MPQTRKTFWEAKIERNKERDREVNKYYKKNGWKNFRIWEHDEKRDLPKSVEKIIDYLNKY